MVDLPTYQSGPETSPAIESSSPTAQVTDATSSVQIDFGAAVSISHPNRRDTRDDVVVVDEPKVFQLHEVDVASVTDAGTAVGVQTARVAVDMRQKTPPGTDRCHRAAE